MVTFPFHNAGAQVVTIRTIESSCGCTIAQIDRKVIAPGEDGELVAVFTPSERVGRQEKSLTVSTDEPGIGPVLLWLKIQIPELISISPRSLQWNAGEQKLEKRIVITSNINAAVFIDLGNTRKSGVVCHLEPSVDRKSYVLVVKPPSTGYPQREVISFKVTSGEIVQAYTALAVIN